MPYISLTKTTLNGKHKSIEDGSNEEIQASETEKMSSHKKKKIFRHPVRDRILGILRDGIPRTQSDIGKILSMSNAAVHYHVKLLLEVGIIKLHSTQPGPNGITEKLYIVDTENWPMVSDDDIGYYIDYMVSWMNERHREGVNILKSKNEDMPPFIVGSYSISAPTSELIRFKREIEKLFNDFYIKYGKTEDQKNNDPVQNETFAVTFAILPSREIIKDDSRNILEFEPNVKEVQS